MEKNGSTISRNLKQTGSAEVILGVVKTVGVLFILFAVLGFRAHFEVSHIFQPIWLMLLITSALVISGIGLLRLRIWGKIVALCLSGYFIISELVRIKGNLKIIREVEPMHE